MSTASINTVYLVTGASRGIGLGLVEYILENNGNAFVYAGARVPAKATALNQLAEKYSGRLLVVKCVSADSESNASLAQAIKERHGHVDTVIANAGFGIMEHTVDNTSVKSFEEHFNVNAMGPVVLFQAVFELLKASLSPRFIPISTGGASLGSPLMEVPMRAAAYGSSKAALNYITRKIHFENEWLVAFPLAPGVVDTDAMKATIQMADPDLAKQMMAMEQFKPLSPIEAAKLLINIVDNSTRAKDGGRFIDIDGSNLPW